MNKCGDCRACCTLLPVDAIEKPVNTRCQHVCATGCSIYQTRPDTCAEFDCAYLQAENVPESLRPDKCGVIFIKRADRIFSGLLMPGVKTTDAAKAQVDSFLKQGYSVVLTSLEINQPLVKLAEGHDPKEIHNEYREALGGDL